MGALSKSPFSNHNDQSIQGNRMISRKLPVHIRVLLAGWSLSLALPAVSAFAQSNSIWVNRDNRQVFLFQDLKARGIGDILTIQINENTDVANSDSRDLSKGTSNSASAGFSYSGNPSSGSASASINSDSARDFAGATNFSSDRRFIDRFSVTVVDVLQNGNLVVAGTREVLVEGDRKRLTVSGIVRPFDILGDNSVRSGNVANLSITYVGEGQEQAFTRQGWLGRRINKLWPF